MKAALRIRTGAQRPCSGNLSFDICTRYLCVIIDRPIMDSIVFYQPPSSERASGGAFRKFTPEPIGSEGEDSYFPTLTEILAQSRRKRANEPSVQGHPPPAQGPMGDGERADAFETATRTCNSLIRETQGRWILLAFFFFFKKNKLQLS